MKRVIMPVQQAQCGRLVLVNDKHGLNGVSGRFLGLEDIGASPWGESVLLESEAAAWLNKLMEAIDGWKYIVPVSGYRSQAQQQKIWDDSVVDSGLEFTEKYVAVPGHSEHQTGLAIDLGLRQDKVDFIRPDFPYTGICQTFRDMAADYGFIERYPEGREAVTHEYMKLDPYFRKFNHGKMTFSLMYAYSENFILVLSHDEVVHLKCSMLGKMPGDREDKFANLKLAYAYMCGHPGKKLLFMGQEFGQWNEWSEKRSLDWYLLEDESHKELKDFTSACLKLNKNYRCLYETDYNSEGFRWINANDKDNSVFSFIRISPDKKKHLLFVLNFTPVERPSHRIGVPIKGKYKLVLGDDMKNQQKIIASKKGECDGYGESLLVDLHRYGIAVYEFNGDVEAHKPTII